MAGHYPQMFGNVISQPLETNCAKIGPDFIDRSICAPWFRSLHVVFEQDEAYHSGDYVETILL